MSKITDSARGERCTIRILGACRDDDRTVVFCHSNELRHGKGAGKKSDDRHGAYGCQTCHDIVDRRRDPPAGMPYAAVLKAFRQGNKQTVRKLKAKGLL